MLPCLFYFMVLVKINKCMSNEWMNEYKRLFFYCLSVEKVPHLSCGWLKFLFCLINQMTEVGDTWNHLKGDTTVIYITLVELSHTAIVLRYNT